MSHEWNCLCPRCEADEARYTGPDPRADEEADRYEAQREVSADVRSDA